jgi:hypothetical protein
VNRDSRESSVTTILSVRGASALAELHVRTYGPVLEADVLDRLARYEVAGKRAHDAIDLAIQRRRLVRHTTNGEAVLAVPVDWRNG